MSAAAAARPVVTVYDNTASASGSVPLPVVLTAPIRPDVVQFVHTNMAKNARQAYAVGVQSGMQHSAESWGTGRAVSRIPRKQGGGTQAAGQAAFGNMCRGGRMFAPTKTWRKWHRKINVNQRRFALTSALAASALPALVMARGHRVSDVPELPLVVDNAAVDVAKTREAVALLTALGGHEDVERCADSKKIRAGKGKMRNRRYTMRRGPLVVYDDGEADCEQAFRNLPGVELCHVDRLNLLQLAPGGHMGRFIVWTQGAFEKLDAIYGTNETGTSAKTGYQLPRTQMNNADIARIINSDEVQSVVRAAKEDAQKLPRKKNPLKNFGAMVRLNPYAAAARRSEVRAQQAREAAKAAGQSTKRSRVDNSLERRQAKKSRFATANAEGEIIF